MEFGIVPLPVNASWEGHTEAALAAQAGRAKGDQYVASLLRHLGALHRHSGGRDEALFTGRRATIYTRIVPRLMHPYYDGIARAVAAALPSGRTGHVLD